MPWPNLGLTWTWPFFHRTRQRLCPMHAPWRSKHLAAASIAKPACLHLTCLPRKKCSDHMPSCLQQKGNVPSAPAHQCNFPGLRPAPQFTRKDTHCLAFSHFGGQCASCSRRTGALEAVQLLAIPVKRTARFGQALFF